MTDTPTPESTEATSALLDAQTFINIFREVGFINLYDEYKAGVDPKDAQIRKNIGAMFEDGGSLDVLPHDISTPVTLIFGAVSLFIAAAKLVDATGNLDGQEAEFMSGLVSAKFMNDDLFGQVFIAATMATLTADITGDREVIASVVSGILADADPQDVAESGITALVVGGLAVHVLDSLGGFVEGV